MFSRARCLPWLGPLACACVQDREDDRPELGVLFEVGGSSLSDENTKGFVVRLESERYSFVCFSWFISLKTCELVNLCGFDAALTFCRVSL